MMAGGIAHDFNNLVTVMLGEVMLAQMEPGLTPPVAASLAEIQKVTVRAQDMTARLKAFAKGESPAKQPVALPRLVREAVERAARGTDVRLQFELPADLPAVLADETQIFQVIHNLALNAVQVMPNGGAIIVTGARLGKERIREVGLAPGTWVGLSLADTGGGISAENLEHLFEPFFTTKATGTGLGLATSYNTIKKHGGLIKVDSTVGFGTTFQVILPAAERPVGPRPGPAAPVSAVNG
jgi:signal transduction histidine kinase